MKILIYCWMLISVLFSCQSSTLESGGVEEILPGSNASIIRNPVEANQPLDSNAIASIQFDQTIFDFGEVMEGVLVEHTFSFANKGKVPLLITDARSTCGCTVPEWPRQPIPPGQVAEISVRFDTKQKFNQQNKPVTITANTLPAQTTIYLRGFVKAQQ